METLSLPPSLPAPLQRAHIAHISNLDPAQSARILARIIDASKLPSAVDEQHTAEQVEAADRERAALDFAFLDPTRLCSKQHLISAILQAALISARSWNPESGAFVEGSATAREGGMKTKTPHSEIIYMLNPGNNVGESLKRFGLSAKSNSLLLVKFSSPSASSDVILSLMQDLLSQSSDGSQARLTLPVASDPQSGEVARDLVDQAIRQGSISAEQNEQGCVTDWKELNKIYKLGIPPDLLSAPSSASKTQALTKYEDICCTSVAMKLVAT